MARRYAVLRPYLDERQRQLVLGAETGGAEYAQPRARAEDDPSRQPGHREG